MSNSNKTHGMSNTRIFRIWYDMKRRCEDVSRRSYKDYGARGISYQEDWKDFINFLNDMEEGYSDDLTLERIDVTKGYYKENCKWILKSEQTLNKRMYRNNELGKANISVVSNKGILTVKVRIQNPSTHKRVCKFFSLQKYTKEEALSLATEWLQEKRVEFGFKESHGSEE